MSYLEDCGLALLNTIRRVDARKYNCSANLYGKKCRAISSPW